MSWPSGRDDYGFILRRCLSAQNSPIWTSSLAEVSGYGASPVLLCQAHEEPPLWRLRGRLSPGCSKGTAAGPGRRLPMCGPVSPVALGLDAAGDIFTLDLNSSTLPAEAQFSPAGVPDAHVTAAPITASHQHGMRGTSFPRLCR
jgi:hypothetical protein